MEQVPPLIQRAIRAGETLRYSGERVMSFKRGSERTTYREFVLKDGANTRIEFPSDSEFAGQIIVETKAKRMHYYPDSNEIRLSPPRREFAFMRLLQMARKSGRGGLKFETGPGGEVAGRKTILAEIGDSRGNKVQKMWIDELNALVLKRELYDPVGALVGSFELVRVNFSPRIVPGDFEIKRAGATIVTPLDLARRVAKENDMLSIFLSDSPGLELEFSRMSTMDGQPVFAQFYRGDGGPISLYQFKGEVKSASPKTRGDMQTYTWQMKSRTFVLVGRADQDALRRLARRLGDR